jgi:hypothetical protein
MDVRILLALVPACSLTVIDTPKRDALVRDCTSHYTAPIVDLGLLAATATTTIAVSARHDYTECNALGCLGLPFAILAMITLPIAALHGFDVVHRCRTEQAYIARMDAKAVRDEDRRRAWVLTKEAAAAARAGDCARTRRISPVVLDLDGEFHSAVFAHDVAVASCLRSDHIGP